LWKRRATGIRRVEIVIIIVVIKVRLSVFGEASPTASSSHCHLLFLQLQLSLPEHKLPLTQCEIATSRCAIDGVAVISNITFRDIIIEHNVAELV
jgi:hypothetical protein